MTNPGNKSAASPASRLREPEPPPTLQQGGYALVEIDLSQPLLPLNIPDRAAGIAVLVRSGGRPLGFWMQPVRGERQLSAESLCQGMERHIGVDLISAILSERLPLASESQAPSPDRTLALSVAICTRDRPDWVKRCLLSLRAVGRTQPAGVRMDVLVVDNASKDSATRDVVAAFEEVRYIHEPVPGLDFARNRALDAATGELIAFLDDDVVVDAGWLEGLVSAWTDHPSAGGFAGLVLPLELHTPAQVWFELRGGFRRGFQRVIYRQGHGGDPRFPLNAGKIGTGANMAFRRDLLLALGGFDEALDTGPPLPGGGDLDMFYRVICAGHDFVYEPRYLVFHQHRRDVEALHRQLESWGTGPMAMLTKIYQQEPAQRGNIHSLLAWWFTDQMRRLASSMIKRQLPTGLVVAELSGGLRGLFGEYGRSRKRVHQRKRQHAPASVSAAHIPTARESATADRAQTLTG